jgi:hypothetical protein
MIRLKSLLEIVDTELRELLNKIKSKPEPLVMSPPNLVDFNKSGDENTVFVIIKV